MLGQQQYARSEHDHYPTPPKATQAFLDHPYVASLIADRVIWEPACGNGAIVKVIAPQVRATYATDLVVYPGDFEPDGLGDFYAIKDLANDLSLVIGKTAEVPDGIITNPPYGKDAERFARHALDLMRPVGGFVAMLCRHEWDAAKGRKDLFDSPAFAAKITLRFRPRWFENTTGAPRHSYAWYVWSWAKDAATPPMTLYAG
ncbi:DNA methyltransferase [Caulobacter phage CcrSC]|uniref:DNA methylase protein n=1 Tax=Caulobacter phage CcrSC TaxID=2283272 RepID=A0A385EDB3_9CAUD|nr:DNA methyltransferase [Caulobacter phage CcrSC]AXQ69763.1 putative DNA methylase protein [Caulobacter phage CcrSC]